MIQTFPDEAERKWKWLVVEAETWGDWGTGCGRKAVEVDFSIKITDGLEVVAPDWEEKC